MLTIVQMSPCPSPIRPAQATRKKKKKKKTSNTGIDSDYRTRAHRVHVMSQTLARGLLLVYTSRAIATRGGRRVHALLHRKRTVQKVYSMCIVYGYSYACGVVDWVGSHRGLFLVVGDIDMNMYSLEGSSRERKRGNGCKAGQEMRMEMTVEMEMAMEMRGRLW